MINVIEGNNINQVVYSAMKKVMNDGQTNDSRNGGVNVLYNTFATIKDPRSRHLSIDGRKSNIIAMMAEVFWIFAGMDEVNPYLSFFLPRAPDFSDDGKTWRGGYGPRIFGEKTEQVQGVIDIINTDGPTTRRAVIDIYDPNLDSPKSLKDVYGLDSSKDIPCNNLIHFYCTPDKPDHLNMTLFQRSGDVCWGWGSINLFEWSVLLEYICQETNLKVGEYNHFVTNLHVYEFTSSQVKDALALESRQDFEYSNQLPMIFPKGGVKVLRQFFRDIIAAQTKIIESEDQSTYSAVIKSIQNILADYDIYDEGNLLKFYVDCVTAHILTKKGMPTDVCVRKEDYNFEIRNAIEHSSFIKFNIETY